MTIPRLRQPVVLVHGLMGYDRFQLAGTTLLSYFVGISEALEAAGNRVYVPRLSPTSGVKQRAAELREYLDRVAPGESYHLFAHSMGGLDSRYMISRLGMAERVRSLTTLGTPHRGTSFADWGIRHVEPLVGPVFELLGLDRQAYFDVTRAACRAFNAEVPDAPGVHYYSVGGRLTLDWMSAGWQLSSRLIQALEGDNDGLVSLTSATWGEEFEVWEGDHASLVNRQLPPLFHGSRVWEDRLPRYVRLFERVRAHEE